MEICEAEPAEPLHRLFVTALRAFGSYDCSRRDVDAGEKDGWLWGAIPAGDMRPGMSMGATPVPMWRPGRILLCCNSFGSGSGLVVAIRQNGLQIYEITSKHPKHCGLCSSAPNAFVSSDVWPPRHARNDFVEMSSYPGALGQLAHFLSNNLQQCI